jgi:uncharacterized glyoxalase superfamily metalloenzyme YdcJ
MKRLAVLWLFAAMLVVSCDMNGGDDGSKETPKAVDSRLVGGRWHDRTISPDRIYYEFTSNSIIIAYNGAASAVTTPAYTANGKVYGTGTEVVILEYEIVSGTEYDALIQAAKDSNDEVLQYQAELKDRAAESGNLARFTAAEGATVEFGRWALVPPNN